MGNSLTMGSMKPETIMLSASAANVNVGIGVRATFGIEDERVADDIALAVMRTWIDLHQTTIPGTPTILGDGFAGDVAGGVRGGMHCFRARILVLTTASEGNRQHFTMRPFAHHVDGG